MINQHLHGIGGGLQVSETISLDEKIIELVSFVTIDNDTNIPIPTTEDVQLNDILHIYTLVVLII